MTNQFMNEYLEYSDLLTEYDIQFKSNGVWLISGTPVMENNWLLFISARPLEMIGLLKSVIPILKEENVSFRIIKNQQVHYQLNEGLVQERHGRSFKILDYAKCTTIYTSSVEQARKLISRLSEATTGFNGPEIVDATRVSKLIYVAYCQKINNPEDNTTSIHLMKLDKSNLPFIPEKRLPSFNLKKRIFGGCFIPIQVIRTTTKGAIYKGINIKKLSLTWCILKVGKAFAFEDHNNRDIRTRLYWEKSVIDELSPAINTPKALSIFNGEQFTCLVLEWIEGETYDKKIRILKNDMQWKNLDTSIRDTLLRYFIGILDIVHAIHSRGYVHRDITATNFIIQKDDNIYILDFELAYSIKDKQPNPSFLLGTFGYVSPEQYEHSVPTISEDIYSLGALLIYTISGIEPEHFMDTNKDNYFEKILEISDSNELASLISHCIRQERNDRPSSVPYIKNKIEQFLTRNKAFIKDNAASTCLTY